MAIAKFYRDFAAEAGIMDGLDIETDDDGITLSFESSYGVHGRIKAKRIVVSFEPKTPE